MWVGLSSTVCARMMSVRRVPDLDTKERDMATAVEDAVGSEFTVVGTRPVRHDGTDKVTGRAVYGADVQLPGLAHGKILRSPHAHARIESVHTARAEAHPGVLAVVTHADLPWTEDRLMEVGEDQVMSLRYLSTATLADGKVLHKGHPVAAVAASSAHAAEDALRLIEVEYEALPAVANVEDAMKPGAPVLHESITAPDGLGFKGESGSNVAGHSQQAMGDPDTGFADADVVVEREFRTKMVHQGYIEPQTCTALWSQDDRLTIWNSSQGQFGMRDQIGRVLDKPVSDIKVVPLEIGGGFGGKLRAYLEPVAALLSKKSGHPVKITMSRAEVLEATGPTSGSYTRIKVGATRDGKLTAGTAFIAFESGAYPGSSHNGAALSMFSPYDIPNVRIDSYDVVDNMPSTAAYRAPGAPIGAFAGESVIDEIAEKLDMDPVELRMKNSAKQGTRMVNGVQHPRIGAFEMMAAVRDHPHYAAPLEGENVGRGVAFGSWGNGAGPACVVANLQANGKFSLIEGSVDIGGTRTAVSQQFAETLGIPVEDIMPQIGDTDSIGYTSNTGGSSVAFKSGFAAYEAALDVRRQLIERAARIWEAPAENIHYDRGELVHASDPELRMSYREIAETANATGGPIVGRANVTSTGAGRAYAAMIVDVHVDPDTGKTDILRCTAFQDAGIAIHPSYVEGQIQGGAAQGIGWALNEEYNVAQDGRLNNTSLLDYRMPTALDLPMIEAVIVEVPNPNHPFGIRGVGEAGIVPPLAAMANAVYRATGVRLTALPMSPPSLAAALAASD